MISHIESLITRQNESQASGITAICSAHPVVLEATLEPSALTEMSPVLIEATCNQVNQDGGYIGMTPDQFRDFVATIAAKTGFPLQQIILGGDHLGPNPWRHLPAAVAMDKAKELVAAYSQAGFTKIHLDASMACADDKVPLAASLIATRSAELTAVAERCNVGQRIIYVIGTEVPPPGGATELIETLSVTPVNEAVETVDLHRNAFADLKLASAFERVVGLVVQPGVEFGNANVIQYDETKTHDLSAARKDLNLIFEAHSTDYQTPASLKALVNDGFAILKVGPWLTFALREALYALDLIAKEMGQPFDLQAGLEAAMLARAADWEEHYHGDDVTKQLQRHFSYSDRIRYYWAQPDVETRVEKMMAFFEGRAIPETLISQYLPASWQAVVSKELKPDAHVLLKEHVKAVINVYDQAI